MRRDFLGLRHPFFLPRWRRVVVVALTGGWAVLEAALGNPGWALAFGAIAAVCGWEYFVVFDPANYKEKDDG